MSYKYFQNKECEFFPCHGIDDQNCLFCFCPLYYLNCEQRFTIENGIKKCDTCTWNHDVNNYEEIIKYIKGVKMESNKIKEALDTLRKAMEEDPEYAWTWHCNLAIMAVDAGAPHKEANERAGDFMKHLFGVNTNRFKEE
jgi:Zn-finger protein